MGNNRLTYVNLLLLNRQISHVLISDLVDVEYVSGFHSSNAALLISAGRNILFTDFRYKVMAEEFCHKNREWEFVMVKEQLFPSMGEFVPPGSVLGIQSTCVTLHDYRDLTANTHDVTFLELTSEVSDLFICKNEHEIASMRKSASIGDAAYAQLLQEMKVGVSELELARKLERICSDLGSEKPSFDTIVLFGSHAALPHGRPGETRLEMGDWILIDFGCVVNGFCSDMTRTAVMGTATQEQRHVYGVVLHAQQTALKAAHAGMACRDLDRIARSIIEDAGYGLEFGHALGHGVGLRIHENPRLSNRSEALLPEDAIVTIEPGIYRPGFGGIRIEDMVHIRKDDAVVLTHTPKDLIEL